jgi:plastocyanin
MQKTRRWMTVLASLAVLTLMAAACGGSDEGGGGGDGGGGGGGALSIAAKDFEFDPTTLDVTSGEDVTITVTNDGDVEHSFTLDDDSVGQDVEPGESATVTVNLTETIGFHCEYHPDQMTGTLNVA